MELPLPGAIVENLFLGSMRSLPLARSRFECSMRSLPLARSRFEGSGRSLPLARSKFEVRSLVMSDG
jgi:hypothetical protein